MRMRSRHFHNCFAWLLLIGMSGLLSGCGEEGLFEPDRSLPSGIVPSSGLTSLQFPTHNGSAWTFQGIGTENITTFTIEGLRYEGGRTLRKRTNSNLEEPTDFYAANAWYLRLDGYFFRRFPIPIRATYFEKTTDALIEYAFDAYLPGFEPPTFHQRHFPERKLWAFPLQPGHRWEVFRTVVPPFLTATREVVADAQTVDVPQGTYSNAYLIEEAVQAEGETFDNPVARYWVAPDVGVVKYEYQNPEGSWRTFVLIRYVSGNPS